MDGGMLRSMMRMVARAMHSSWGGAPEDAAASILGVRTPVPGAELLASDDLGAGGGCGGFP